MKKIQRFEMLFEDLQLRKHGLEWRKDDLPHLAPERDGPGILLSREPTRAREELSRHSPSDGKRYGEWRAFLERVRPLVTAGLSRPPCVGSLLRHLS